MVFEGEKKKRTKRTKRTCEIVTRVGGARMGWMEKEVELEKEERIYIYIYIEWNKMIPCVEQNGR